jgi:hypothetical protein
VISSLDPHFVESYIAYKVVFKPSEPALSVGKLSNITIAIGFHDHYIKKIVPNKIVGNIWLQLGDKCSSREHLRIPESHPYSNICKVKLTI